MNWLGTEPGRKGAGGDDLRLRSQQQPAKLALVVVAEFEAAVEQQVRLEPENVHGLMVACAARPEGALAR